MTTRREFLATAATGAAALALAPSRMPAADAASAGPRWPVAGFTKPFQNLGVEAIADTVAEIGWDGVECPVRPRGQIEPERVADELPPFAEALRQRGKAILVLATGITRVQQPHTERVLRTAAQLGIGRVRLGFMHYQLDRPIPAQVADFGAQLRDLAALCGELGLQAGVENHSGIHYVGGPVWDLWTMMQGLDPRHLGVCFDLGHATIEGGTTWPVQARLMADRFTSVIVKDFLWQRGDKGWQPQWVPLGAGMADPKFFAWLKTTAYAGPIVQHHEYDHGRGAAMIARMQADLRVLRGWLTGATGAPMHRAAP